MNFMNFFENLFFRRAERMRRNEKEFYTYDLSEKARIQIVYTILERMDNHMSDEFAQRFAKELGRPVLYEYSASVQVPRYNFGKERIEAFIRNEPPELVLSLIEYLLAFIYSRLGYSLFSEHQHSTQELNRLIDELNRLFEINKIGYEVVSVYLKNDLPFIIVPIYSKFMYVETIKKPISLLCHHEFRGALEEFEDALENLKDEKYDLAIVEANKAFESTLKAIMDKKGISYSKSDTVRKLVTKLFESDFIDSYLKDCFDRLINILESGLPTIRNQPGAAHGSGLEPKNISKSYANFAIHLTGAYIVFLIELFDEYSKK